MLPIISKVRNEVAKIDTQFPGNSFLCQRVSFIWFGMWRPLNSFPDEQHFLTESARFYRIYSSFLLGSFVYASIGFQIVGILMVNNIDDLVTSAFSLLTLTTTVFKVTRFNLLYKNIRELLETLNEAEFRPKNDEENRFLRTAINRTFYINFIYVLVCFLVLGQWIVLSAMNGTLMFRAWYPWDVTLYPLFILTSFYQAVSFFVLIVTSSAIDNFVVGLVLHIHAQVQRLGSRLSQIGYKNEATSSVEMVECVRFHQKLLRLIPNVEGLFGAITFVQLCVSVMVFCTTGFVLMTKEYDNFFLFLSNLIYFSLMLFKILMCCFVGNDLIYASNELTAQAFQSNFIAFDKKTKQLLLMFMRGASINMKVRAKLAFEFDLSLPTFLLLLKSSYSYFAVLQNVSDN